MRTRRAYVSRPYKAYAGVITGSEPQYISCKAQIEDNPSKYNYTQADDKCSTVEDIALYNKSVKAVQIFDCYNQLTNNQITSASLYKRKGIPKSWVTSSTSVPNVQLTHQINDDCSETVTTRDTITGKVIDRRTVAHSPYIPPPVADDGDGGTNGGGFELPEFDINEITKSELFLPGVIVAVLLVGGLVVYGMKR